MQNIGKITEFLQYWESPGKFGKNLSCKVQGIYISRKTILLTSRYYFFFYKSIIYIELIGCNSLKRVKRSPVQPHYTKKMKKIRQNYEHYWNIWNIKTYFEKNFSVRYIKVYSIRKTMLSPFHYFLFHENILYASEVIKLLAKVYRRVLFS